MAWLSAGAASAGVRRGAAARRDALQGDLLALQLKVVLQHGQIVRALLQLAPSPPALQRRQVVLRQAGQ